MQSTQELCIRSSAPQCSMLFCLIWTPGLLMSCLAPFCRHLCVLICMCLVQCEMMKISCMEEIKTEMVGEHRVVHLKTVPHVDVPKALLKLLGTTEFALIDILTYPSEAQEQEGPPYVIEFESHPPVMSSRITIKGTVTISVIDEKRCRQTQAGTIDVRIMGFGGMIQKTTSHNMQETYRQLPGVVAQWVSIRETAKQAVETRDDGTQMGQSMMRINGVPMQVTSVGESERSSMSPLPEQAEEPALDRAVTKYYDAVASFVERGETAEDEGAHKFPAGVDSRGSNLSMKGSMAESALTAGAHSTLNAIISTKKTPRKKEKRRGRFACCAAPPAVEEKDDVSRVDSRQL
eukprot:jgi/Mesvir1/20771/Mv07889-RA.1